MKLLYYHNAKSPNFGDELNGWLWPRLFPGLIDEDAEHLFVGIGTILDQRVPAARKITVFGTGIRSPESLPRIDESWDVRFLRGPISARHLGGRYPHVTDPAYCLQLLEWPDVQPRYEFSFIPWFLNRGFEWKAACRSLGFHYIDPCSSVDSVIEQIRSSKRIITEAMHGAILADTFRVPWIRIKSMQHLLEEPGVSQLKWSDWMGSVGIDAPVSLPEIPKKSRLRHLINPFQLSSAIQQKVRGLEGASRLTPSLSAQPQFEEVISKLSAQVERLRRQP